MAVSGRWNTRHSACRAAARDAYGHLASQRPGCPIPIGGKILYPPQADPRITLQKLPERRVLVRQHIGLHVAERRLRLVPDAVIEGLDDLFLEPPLARMQANDRLPHGIVIVGIRQSKHIHFDTGGDQGDDRMHVLRDAGGGMQRDRRPHRIDILLGNVVRLQEIPGGVGTVDLETLIGAAVLLRQAHVVKHRAGIQQFGIETQPTPLAGKRAPEINPA
jgi:hypothetical protein